MITTIVLIACAVVAMAFIAALAVGLWSRSGAHKSGRPRRMR